MTGSHLQAFDGVLLLVKPTFKKSYAVLVFLVLRIKKMPFVPKICDRNPEFVDDGVEIVQLHPMVVRPRIQRTDIVVELSELRNVTLLEDAERLLILRIEKVPFVPKICDRNPELVKNGVEVVQLHSMVVRPRVQRTDVVVELSELRNVTLLEDAKRLFILLALQGT